MALAGYSSRLQMTGPAVPATGIVLSLVSSTVFQAAPGSDIWDPSAAVAVYIEGVLQSANDYTVDYLFGRITFTGTPPGVGDEVTVDASYLPYGTIGEVREFSFQGSADLLDRTTFDSDGARQKLVGLIDASGSFAMLKTLLDEIDTGVDQHTLADRIDDGETFVLELRLGTKRLRLWVVLEGGETQSAVDGLVETSCSYQTTAPARGSAVSLDTSLE